MYKLRLLPITLILVLLVGCAPTITYDMKSDMAPPFKYCNDFTGHVPNAKPWILGGTCCCTPTESMFEIYKSEGTVDEAMSYAGFLQLFEDRGIVTDLDHKACNNQCEHGPHVVFGGHCMCTPTPATDNYEEVIAGVRKETASSEDN